MGGVVNRRREAGQTRVVRLIVREEEEISMATPSTTRERVITVLRWIARIGSGLFAIALTVLLANGVSSWIRRGAVDIPTLMFLVIAIIALVLAWFWELAGGALLLGVAVVILGFELSEGVVDGGPFVFGVLGALFVYCWWASRPRERILRTV